MAIPIQNVSIFTNEELKYAPREGIIYSIHRRKFVAMCDEDQTCWQTGNTINEAIQNFKIVYGTAFNFYTKPIELDDDGC